MFLLDQKFCSGAELDPKWMLVPDLFKFTDNQQTTFLHQADGQYQPSRHRDRHQCDN